MLCHVLFQTNVMSWKIFASALLLDQHPLPPIWNKISFRRGRRIFWRYSAVHCVEIQYFHFYFPVFLWECHSPCSFFLCCLLQKNADFLLPVGHCQNFGIRSDRMIRILWSIYWWFKYLTKNMIMTMRIKLVTILVDGGHDALVIPLIMKIIKRWWRYLRMVDMML